MVLRNLLFSLPVALVITAAASCSNGSRSGTPTAPSAVTGSTSVTGGTPAGGGSHGHMDGPMNGPASGPMTGPGGGMGSGGMSMMLTSEFAYMAMMIPHHHEAIAAATVLRAGTRRAEMRQFAATIITTQEAERARLQTWLAAWYPGRDPQVDYRPMMRDLAGLTGDALDRAFLEDMIPHHMMAVMMSQQLLVRDLAQHPALIPFATTIRDTQQAEIRTMRGWVAQWFGG